MTGTCPDMSADDQIENLSAPQVAAVRMLVATGRLKDAAEAAGCSERTIRRWLAQADIAAAYRSVARDAAREAVSGLIAAQRLAVESLVVCLSSESDAVKVRSARAILEVGARALDDDLDQRLDDLERRMAEWQQDRPALHALPG